MGPFDLEADYGDVVIATREADGSYRNRFNGWFIFAQSEVLLFCFIGAYVSGSFLLYFLFPYIGLLVALALIGLGYLSCYRYGTNNRLFCYRKKLTKAQLERIQQRLRSGR